MIHEITGFGPLEPLLNDPTITEVMVNGPEHIYIERAGKILRVDSFFLNEEHVLRIIDRIITPLGRRLDETSPRVDARLPDGSRVNAIIAPLSLIGPVITVRKFSKTPYTVQNLINFGTSTPEMFEFLRSCIEARLNVFVSGGTGSGQDDLPERPVVVHPQRRADRDDRGRGRAPARQEHVVTLEARPPNIEGEGEIAIRDLLRNAMHMRPDRVIVGECRSGEALDMLQAMTTGQDGSLSDRSRQHPQGHAPAPRDDGPHDGLRPAAARHSRADRVCRRPHRPHRATQGRLAQGHAHHRGLRDRGRRDPDPGHLRVRQTGSSTARSRAS